MRSEKQNRPIVLLDCDGVLADFLARILEIVEDITGLTYEPSAIDRWDFCDALGIRGIDASLVRQAIAGPGFASSLMPCDGARDGVRALQEIADVRIVTTPWDSSDTWESERKAWLWRHFKIPASHVIHTHEKFRVRGDVFVDDRMSHVQKWRAAWPDALAIAWRTPQNAGEIDAWNGPWCASWETLIALVRERSSRTVGEVIKLNDESADAFENEAANPSAPCAKLLSLCRDYHRAEVAALDAEIREGFKRR